MFKICVALLLGSAFFISPIIGQTYELGAFTGLALYKGDISNMPNPTNLGGDIVIMGRYNIDYYSTIRINISEGVISGKDNNTNQTLGSRRNTSFQTGIGELSFIYEHNFFPYRKEKERIITTPYAFGGLGFFGFRTSGGAEQPEKNGFNPVIPFGVGTKTMLNKNWNLNFEFGTRKTFTDYLDNTHDMVNEKQNGFRNTLDWYSFLNVGVTYTFYTVKCP